MHITYTIILKNSYYICVKIIYIHPSLDRLMGKPKPVPVIFSLSSNQAWPVN